MFRELTVYLYVTSEIYFVTGKLTCSEHTNSRKASRSGSVSTHSGPYANFWNLKAFNIAGINLSNLKSGCVCAGGGGGPLVQILDH